MINLDERQSTSLSAHQRRCWSLDVSVAISRQLFTPTQGLRRNGICYRLLRRCRELTFTASLLRGVPLAGSSPCSRAERDSTIRAAVTFGAAAGSWEHSAEVRNRLHRGSQNERCNNADSMLRTTSGQPPACPGGRTGTLAQALLFENLPPVRLDLGRRSHGNPAYLNFLIAN
jgi:hypothetical protein